MTIVPDMNDVIVREPPVTCTMLMEREDPVVGLVVHLITLREAAVQRRNDVIVGEEANEDWREKEMFV